MKVLFFGDTFGRPGREAVKAAIAKLVPQHGIDFVVVNGENFSHGNGILPEMAEEFFGLGVDVITLGNHAWDQKQIIPYMATSTRLLRPANYPDHPAYTDPELIVPRWHHFPLSCPDGWTLLIASPLSSESGGPGNGEVQR